MKKQLMAFGLALSMTLGSAVAEAKTFTWAASLDVMSMDPYSTNNSFTNSFMTVSYTHLTLPTNREV